MSEPTKEEMMECWKGIMIFMTNHGWNKIDERVIAIQHLIEQGRPKITKADIFELHIELIHIFNSVEWGKGRELIERITIWLKKHDVEVNKE